MKENKSLQLGLQIKKRWYRMMSIWIMMALTGCWGQKKAKKVFDENINAAPFDAIIVTGIPYDGESWDNVMMLRVYWAKYLYDQGVAKNIVFSGGAVYTPYVEAEVMKKYAVALGVPSEVIFTEIRAEHSTENVYYSLLMCYQQGFENMALATDPYQLYFMRKVFTKKGVKLHYLPMDYEILGAMEKSEPEIDVSSAKVADFIPITDREGVWKRWKGTRGEAVDFTKLK